MDAISYIMLGLFIYYILIMGHPDIDLFSKVHTPIFHPRTSVPAGPCRGWGPYVWPFLGNLFSAYYYWQRNNQFINCYVRRKKILRACEFIAIVGLIKLICFTSNLSLFFLFYLTISSQTCEQRGRSPLACFHYIFSFNIITNQSTNMTDWPSESPLPHCSSPLARTWIIATTLDLASLNLILSHYSLYRSSPIRGSPQIASLSRTINACPFISYTKSKVLRIASCVLSRSPATISFIHIPYAGSMAPAPTVTSHKSTHLFQ